ncbi:hypothetical protein BH24ACT10_BH24ACT10_18310 [soil metagenome]
MTAPKQVASTAQGEAAAVAGTAKDEAAHVASTAVGAAGDVAGTAKQEVGNVLAEGLDQAKNLTSQVKEQAGQQLSTGSEKLTGSLRGLSQQLDEGDTSGVVGQVLSEAGQRVQALADRLEQRGPEGILTDLQGYARRNPGTFLIGMAATGFLTGRIVKGLQSDSSSSQQPALPPSPRGTAAGDPLAGISEPSVGLSAGYAESPYPESTYQPIEPAPLEPSYSASGATTPTSSYFDEPATTPVADSPLPGETQPRGAL